MDKIASALVKAQKAFAPALKTSTNPHFKSKYADLAACVEAVIDALNTNGIALIQKQHPNEGGVAVETVFVHESGETLSAGIFTTPAAKQDPQGYGSAMTYARRYSLMAACGIAPEDDDGNAATKTTQEATKRKEADRTIAMKCMRAIREAIANDKELGAMGEWEAAKDKGEEFAKDVWAGLTGPEREFIRNHSQKAAA
ncbi:MAG: ERF family protein [Inhella sp.]|jgi:hypothetical protein